LFQCITGAKLVNPTSTKQWHTVYEFQPNYGPNMSVTGEMGYKYSAHILHKNSSWEDISPQDSYIRKMNNDMYCLDTKSILFFHNFKICTIVQDLVSSKIMSAQKKGTKSFHPFTLICM